MMNKMMEKIPNWLELWRQLALNQGKAFHKKDDAPGEDFWKDRAKSFDKMVRDRWEKPDSTRLFLSETLRENPGSTVLDIGAGTGAWSIFLSRNAKSVTALDPSESMLSVLRDKITAAGVTNINLVNGSWPDADVEPHDYLLASHSMYGEADFESFISKMCQTARKRCYLCMKVLFNDTIMAKATQRIWGQPFDSPNFQIALNALHQMDIYPNVLMETGGVMGTWTSDSPEDAIYEIKSRLGVENTDEHDDFLLSLIDGALTFKEGKWHWPVGNGSALVYWDV